MYVPTEGYDSFHFQTELLWKSRNEIQRVARVASVVVQDYIGNTGIEWNRKVNKGSFTLSEETTDSKLVITLFIDFDNKLAEKFGLSIHTDLFVIAIDMSVLPHFVYIPHKGYQVFRIKGTTLLTLTYLQN